MVGEIIFSKKYIASFHGIHKIVIFKHQIYLFSEDFLTLNFFTPKFMKIRWSSFFFGFFVHHFQIKLSKYDSNSTIRFISMIE